MPLMNALQQITSHSAPLLLEECPFVLIGDLAVPKGTTLQGGTRQLSTSNLSSSLNQSVPITLLRIAVAQLFAERSE